MNNMPQANNREYSSFNPHYYDYNSTDPSVPAEFSRVSGQKRKESRKRRAARLLRVMIILLAFTVFLQLAYHLYFARNVRIDRIVISADSGFGYTDEQVLKMSGIDSSVSYFSVKTDDIEAKLERYPQIADAEVDKHFPNRLDINIRSRTALAICLIDDGGLIIPAAVDANGVIFQIGKSVSDTNLPVLSGIRMKEARLGSKMPVPITGFLGSLEKLRSESPVFFNSISELQFIKKSNDDFEVLMYPQNYSIPVRIGSRIDRELFTYMILVLDVVKQQGIAEALEELDFRTDEVVYRIREE